MKLVIKNIFNNLFSEETVLFQKISYSIMTVIVASILFSLIQKYFIFDIKIVDLVKADTSVFETIDNQKANTASNIYKLPLEDSNFTYNFLSKKNKT